MSSIITRLRRAANSRRIGLALYLTLIITTAVAVGAAAYFSVSPANLNAELPPELSNTTQAANNNSDIALSPSLSQTKLVQNEDGTVYLNLAIKTPTLGTECKRIDRATDMTIVLDRSGSMADPRKLPYAKAALKELLNQLSENDRFALISFDSSAVVHSGLQAVSASARESLSNAIAQLQPGNSTNLSDGLNAALGLIQDSPSDRTRKVILLSDGEANEGITSLPELNRLAGQFAGRSIVLSTIGMGLGFNETLMASMADYGMGSYSYLEHLDLLGEILAKNLSDSRSLYAETSSIELTLKPGVHLVDAGSYPYSQDHGNASTVRIQTGQLLNGSNKNIIFTFRAPTSELGDFDLANISLNITTKGKSRNIGAPKNPLRYSVVAPARRDEAVASMDKDMYRKSWVENNYGKMKLTVSEAISRGDKEKAVDAINSYRQGIAKAEKKSGAELRTDRLEADLGAVQSHMESAFSGPLAEQPEKQNRLSKELQLKGRREQRLGSNN